MLHHAPSLAQAGSDCTVTESDATVPDTSVQSTITPNKFKLLDDSSKPVKVTVNADNNYTYVDGGFTITKQVEGNAVSFAPEEFTMNYECVAPDYGTAAAEPTIPEASKSAEVAETQTSDLTPVW